MAEPREGIDPARFGQAGKRLPELMEACAKLFGTKGWLLRGWRFYLEDEEGNVTESSGYADGFHPDDGDDSSEMSGGEQR